MVKKGFANLLASLLITMLLGLAILIGFAGFTAYNKSGFRKGTNGLSTAIAVSPTISPIVSTVPSPSNPLPSLYTPQPVVTSGKNKEVLKNEIFGLTGLEVDAFDVSKDGTNVGFLGHDAKWSSYGVYLYNVTSKKSTPLYELKQAITGRGGYYADNLEIKLSPDGNFLFANKTGTNFPQFMIFRLNGELLYTSKTDLGHATWLDNNNLLYVSSMQVKPLVFNTTTMDSTPSKLPENTFGLKANAQGTYILAFSLPVSKMQCESFDLKIYSYSDGKLIRSVQNTSLDASWQSDSAISLQKVESCRKSQGESMSEYSPVTTAQTVDINTP